MIYNELSRKIIGAAFRVHSALGCGLLESCYHTALFIELGRQEIVVRGNHPFNVFYEGCCVGEYFADLVVDSKIILEIKSVSAFSNKHTAQLLNYLHIAGLRVGYLLNFQNLRLEYRRYVV